MTGLAIVLPGANYTPAGPAIRFPVLAAWEAGYQSSVAVEYPPGAMRTQDLPAVVAEVRRQLIGADFEEFDRMTVIAKSMGTRVVVEIADMLDRVEDLSIVWLTPLFGDRGIRDGAIGSGWRSLIVFGDQDPFHNEAGVTEVSQALQAPVVRVSGANHALESPGDVIATISGLREVTSAVQEFLAP
ncbi:MAG: hypothetical protein HKN24_09925 [Acidimicrobiales bacterium]|nr:hypothetical protein [Acidimicrobiales bacterium]